MDYLKDFLKQLTKTKKYYAEMVGNAAEIFVDGEPDPVVLLEFDSSYYNINLRCDLFNQFTNKEQLPSKRKVKKTKN